MTPRDYAALPCVTMQDFADLAIIMERDGLTAQQRAMVAALLTMREPKALTIAQAAAVLKVFRNAIDIWRVVLLKGTQQEIDAVCDGSAALSTVARNILGEPKAALRPIQQMHDDKVALAERRRLKGLMWTQLRDAIENLSGLPQPESLVAIARKFDRQSDGRFIDQRLSTAINWLREFQHAWQSLADQNRAGSAHAGNGAAAPRTQHTQSPHQRSACAADCTPDHQ